MREVVPVAERVTGDEGGYPGWWRRIHRLSTRLLLLFPDLFLYVVPYDGRLVQGNTTNNRKNRPQWG